jgi:hypothetical protein
MLRNRAYAGMAELADAAALGAAGRKPLGVQIPLPAPFSNFQSRAGVATWIGKSSEHAPKYERARILTG